MLHVTAQKPRPLHEPGNPRVPSANRSQSLLPPSRPHERAVFSHLISQESTVVVAPPSPSTFHLRRRTPGSFVLVPFDRQGRSIRCQGQLEAAAAVVLANCPRVLSIREQPLSIPYAWRETPQGVQFQLLGEAVDAKEQRRRRGDARDRSVLRITYIIPDFLIEMQDAAPYLLEIKPSRKLHRPDVRRKQAVATAYAQNQGWRYRIITERQLFQGPLLANLRLLNRYRRSVCDPRLLERLIDHVSTEPIRAGELIRRCSGSLPASVIRAGLFHLLSSGRLDCDPQRAALNDDTLIFSGGTIQWDPFDSAWGPNGCSMDVSSGSSGSRRPTASSSST
ncbi:MAG: hypothetical protein CMJ48_08095 [Planctomycetaceae bacterium]|nr:hypothetical protein [Planctomycetaceae bacterium]